MLDPDEEYEEVQRNEEFRRMWAAREAPYSVTVLDWQKARLGLDWCKSVYGPPDLEGPREAVRWAVMLRDGDFRFHFSEENCAFDFKMRWG